MDGQFVKEGDLLYVIDPRPYEIAVDLAKADVAKAQAQVAVASTDAVRARHLIETSAITLRDADQRKTNLDVAKAQQLSSEAALRNAELNLEWTRVRAPISGRVSNHRVDVGNLVQSSQFGATLLTTIVTLDPIHFVFDASESDYIRYARLASAGERPSSREFKNPVMVRLADEPNWSHSHAGVMDFIDNQINARAGTIRGRAIFENKDLFLLPGTFGKLRLFGGNIDALLIPDATILSDQASRDCPHGRRRQQGRPEKRDAWCDVPRSAGRPDRTDGRGPDRHCRRGQSVCAARGRGRRRRKARSPCRPTPPRTS